MTGPAFHDFLIRGANDRLLTDRVTFQVIDGNNGFLVDFTNEHYARRKTAYETKDYDPLWRWNDKTQHGFRRAPVELIAHVVENDRPYTEILTANYIMANRFPPKHTGPRRYSGTLKIGGVQAIKNHQVFPQRRGV